MKRAIHFALITFCMFTGLFAQVTNLKVESAGYNPINTFPTIQSNANAISIASGDTLRYFLNKHYYRNPSSGSPAPNTQYFTLLNPYPNNALVISHAGSVFKNNSPITVTGLEGIVTRRNNAVSQTIPMKLYICNVNASNLPIFPPLDSVIAISTATNNGAWLGANFTTPLNINGNFAVLFRNATTTPGDTLGLFINNACTPTSTCTAARKYGESLGVLRVNGNWQSNTNAFGTGTDYEFIVAPRVQFNYSSGVSVYQATACLNGSGQFTNTTTPMDLVENRQFNFNKFAAVWGALSNTLLPGTDSIYNWTFSGSPTGPLTTKDAIAVFNVIGIQTASLAVKYNKSRAGGNLPSIQDVATGTINISASNTPTVAITGNTFICAGSSTTLTASGTATYNWGGPVFNNPVVVVSPTSTTVYTVVANNGICAAFYPYTVNVTPSPNMNIIGPSTACYGATLLLTVSGASSYTWSTGSTAYSTAVTPTIVGVQIYTVMGETAPCAPVVAVKSITVNPVPLVTLTSPGNTVCTLATGGTTLQFIGSPLGGSYTGANASTGIFSPISAGVATVSYSYTDPTSQCSKVASSTINVLSCQTIGVDEFGLDAALAIFPNPSSNGKIEIGPLQGSNSISVYNSLGAELEVRNCDQPHCTLDLSKQSDGVYFIKVSNSQGSSRTFRCILQKQ